MKMTKRLRELAFSGTAASAATAYDGLTAKLVCEAGFDVVTSSGFQISASIGFPDMELYTMTENLNAARNIARASTVPVISDIDTGYGNALNVMRTVREFEQAGVAGILLEDQTSPKRCPALAVNKLLPIDEAAGKVRAAVEARQDPDFLIIGRTDEQDVQAACRRLRAYVTAGADMVFVTTKCAKSFQDLQALREAAGRPLLLTMSGFVTALDRTQINEVGGVAAWGLETLLTATESVRRNLKAMKEAVGAPSLPCPVADISSFKKLIGYAEFEALQDRYQPASN